MEQRTIATGPRGTVTAFTINGVVSYHVHAGAVMTIVRDLAMALRLVGA